MDKTWLAVLWGGVVSGVPAAGAEAPLAAPGGAGDGKGVSVEAVPAELVLDTRGFRSEVTGLAFSPDGVLLAAAGEKEVRVWNVVSGELVATLRGDREKTTYGNCYAVAFSPDGKHLLVGIDSYTAEGSIRVYPTGRWDEIEQLLAGHDVPVKHLAFSPDGQYLASAGSNGKILFWQWRDRRVVGSAPPPRPDQPVYLFFEFPTDKPLLLTGGLGSLALISVPDGATAGPQTSVPDYFQRWLGALAQTRFPLQSSPGRLCLRLEQALWLASGWGKGAGTMQYWVGVWHSESRVPRQVYLGHSYAVQAVELNPAGTLAASADAFGEIHVWETRTGSPRHVLGSLGRPVYRAAFGPAGRDLGFTTTSHSADRFDRNRCGTIDRAWLFDKRRVVPARPADFPRTETVAHGDRTVQVEFADNLYYLATLKQGVLEKRYRIRAGAMPMCYSFLRSGTLGIESLVAVGDDGGYLLAYHPASNIERRTFVGHHSMVTSLSESADGRFLATSSTDRTIRVWSLEKYRPTGDFDFRCLADQVVEVEPGGSGAAAGIQVGDKFVSLDSRNLTELDRLLMSGKFPYAPGQRVALAMQRAGQPYQASVVLREGGDVLPPLLSLFLADEKTWIVWTPQGYYDASPGADQLIGWHLNQGPRKSAKFYPVHHFRKQLYRPDVIDLVLETGDVEAAVRKAEEAGTRRAEQFDLRQPEELQRLEPPLVRILEPADGTRTSQPRIKVRVELASQNQLPVREVTVLVNGRPAAPIGSAPLARGVVRLPLDEQPGAQPGGVGAADASGKTAISQEVTLVPGQNTISVVASNTASTSPPQSVRVVCQAAEASQPRGNLYVLAVGISQYKNPKHNLRYADRDAEAFVRAWKAQEGVFYSKVESRMLLNDQATAANVRDAMDWLLQSVTQHDMAILFFSAHGIPDTRRNYYLATHEVDPARLRSTAVPSSDVNRLIQDMPCKVLVFVDTCHSGGITGAKALGDDPWQELVAAETGAIVFASSTPREISLERDEWRHGAFTKAFLDTVASAKSDTNGNGYLEVTELDDHLSNRVKELTAGQQHPVTAKPPTIRNIPLARVPFEEKRGQND